MLLHRFNQSIIDDMLGMKLKVADVRDNGESVMIRCQHIDTQKNLNLRIRKPVNENDSFDFSQAFLVDALVIGGRRVYKTYEFTCATAEFVNVAGGKTTVKEG